MTEKLKSGLAIVLLSLAATTVGGCASASHPVEVEAPVPEAWQNAPTEALEAATSGTDWWSAFEDEELDRIIELALTSNRDLRSAAARLDSALAQARIAGAARKPQAGVALDASRRKQNFIGLPIPGAEGQVLSNTSTALGSSLNVSWEADLWGRIRDTQLAAQARVEAAAYDLEGAKLSIAGQTAKAWLAWVEASGQVELSREAFERRASTRERIEKRYRQGLRTALDLRLATANEANAQAQYAGRRRQQQAIRRQLEILTGRNDEALQILGGPPRSLPALPVAVRPGLPTEVLSQRPDLQASERRLAAAGLDVETARKLLYPRLTLTGSTGRTSQELEDLLDGKFSVWSLATGLLQPLFQGGRLRAGVALSQAGRQDVLAQHENAVIRAVADIETHLANDTFLAEQQSAVARAKEASTAAEVLARDRYFAGLADYLSVLAAQSQATVAASQLLEVDRLRLEQRVDLFLALGGRGASGGMTPATEESEESE